MSIFIENNYLVLENNFNNIKKDKWLEVIENIIKYLSYNFDIISAYLRGSVLKGTQIDNISDIDLLIITKNKYIKYYELSENYEIFLKKKYPFFSKIDIFITDLKKLFLDEGIMFQIKYESKCIFGEDLSFYIDNFKLSYNICFNIKSLYYIYDDFNINDYLNFSSIKRIIRACFELCLIREKTYTKELKECLNIFLKYYPDKLYYTNTINNIINKNFNNINTIFNITLEEKKIILELVKFIINEYNALVKINE